MRNKKPITGKMPKKRNLLVVAARSRRAGPMADKRPGANCQLCGDDATINHGLCQNCMDLDE